MIAFITRTALCLLLVLTAGAAHADRPADPVTRLNDGILTLMRAAESGVPAAARLRDFESVIRESFDLETSLRVAVPGYDRAPEPERRALLGAFARRNAAQYVSRFDGYSGETIEIAGERSGPRNTTLVETRLLRPQGSPVVLTYVVRRMGDGWGIVDVLLNGSVSQLAVQRSDFAATLRSGGIPALTREFNAYADGVTG
ncbi:ABC transporter substrate-binding protein [Skermanella rosea]|uniref:ABC transporter substrate-binding protein n=1 Tax=Skermanella rosea TaxID=1817965 RepID=UPI0019329572|nr:ABC transporter substrate-binding protein [Skermanella rosea]UEM05814.1 ABC transporter substrate-binding protein [Skermanella rosea]